MQIEIEGRDLETIIGSLRLCARQAEAQIQTIIWPTQRRRLKTSIAEYRSLADRLEESLDL
jgi:hypothetical protein